MSDRLHRLLGTPDAAWLVERVRTRLERGRPLTGTITLTGASAGQRRAIEALLGRRPSLAGSLSVDLGRLDEILRTSGVAPDGLAAAVITLTGPVTDRDAARQAEADAWRRAYGELDRALTGRPELAGWRTWLETTGLVRRLAGAPDDGRALLDQVARVLVRLPSPGIPLGRLAAETCGDAHALDDGRPAGTLALSAARFLTGAPDSRSAEARRTTWEAVGVHLDELSSYALCLGIDGLGPPGEPSLVTLRRLRQGGAPVAARTVRICENPVVVAAAADELGAACPPLVCTGGHPSLAVWRLLERLAEGGARFVYHGDFDWGGVGIAAAVYERFGFTAWRYDAPSYEAGLAAARTLGGEPQAMTGRHRATPWDPALAGAMIRHGVRIEEELALTDLLADLHQ